MWNVGHRRLCGAGVSIGFTVANSRHEGKIIMAMNQSSNDEPRPTAIEKKPYEKPGFRYEEVFVTTALSCGKLTGGTGQDCMLNPKMS
jgi:hypothetical protein